MSNICGIKKCCRKECRFYRNNIDNCCMALREVYLDDSTCPFFKPVIEAQKQDTKVFKTNWE